MIQPGELFVGLGPAAVALRDLCPDLAAAMLIDQPLETEPYGLGAVGDDPDGNQGVHLSDEPIIEPRHELCHTMSIP